MLSTHDLTRRSTPPQMEAGLYCASFNSRPHTEVDMPQESAILQEDDLSTHDLTRRSTCRAETILPPASPFNSRPHTEVDTLWTDSIVKVHSFNSRPHTEVDMSSKSPSVVNKLSTHDLTRRSTALATSCRLFQISFNSRPHTEVDRTPTISTFCKQAFNSRPHTEVD